MNRPGFKAGKARSLFLLFILGMAVFSQGVYPQVEGLKIQFLNIGISDTTIYNDLPADFPHPVLSLIQIQDNYKHYIHGLAAMDQWLGPEDISEIGVPVNDVWEVITDRHAYDENYPANQNVKTMEPQFMVAELSQVAGYGISMALAMDYSGSMGWGIYEAEAAAKLLVRKINKNDQVAISKITDKVKIYQEFTSDTTLLMEAIDTPTPNRSGTAVNLGIYETVKACENVTGRRCVVVYTDGLNDMPGPSSDEIIALAQELNVTVFTIGLGKEIDEEDLGRIAVETGGYYRRTPSPSSLGLIYEQIYNYINGFYALAHTSTDPFYNGTLRRVDIDVQSTHHRGHGWGTYYVPFLPRNVRIKSRVVTDSMMVFQGDTLYFATSDDTISYNVTIDCDGPGIARDVVIKNVPDNHILPFSYDLPPDTTIGDTLIWNVYSMKGGTQITLHYQAQVSTYLPMHTVELENHAYVNCPFDSIESDNYAVSTVLAKGHPDFKVRCQTDTGLASPGHPLQLRACLSNYGNANAVVPVGVRFYLDSPGGQLIDERFVESLNLSDSTMVYGVWANPIIGTHKIYYVVDEDNEIKELLEDNNVDSCMLQVGISTLELQVGEISFRDRIREKRGGFPGTMLAKMSVVDQNSHTVFGLADQTRWIGLSETAEAGESAGNLWPVLNEYSSDCSGTGCIKDVRNGMQMTELRKDSVKVVFIAELSNSMNGWRQTLQKDIAGIISPDMGDRGAVVGMGQSVELLQAFTQDTTLLYQAVSSGGNTQKRMVYDACLQGVELARAPTGRKALVAMVSGREQGGSQSLGQVIEASQDNNVPVFLVQIGSGPYSEDFKVLADTTGGWYFQIQSQDEGARTVGLLEDMLRNYYCLSYASPDTLRNETLRTLTAEVHAFGLTAGDAGVYRAPAGFADLSLVKIGQAKSRYLTQTGTLGRVQPGDSITYTLTFENTGHYDLHQIVVRDSLPENLVVAESSMPYTFSGSETVSWQIDSLLVFESGTIQYTCFVDTVLSEEEFYLVNRAEIDHPDDEIMDNDTSSDTVVFVPLKGPDLNIFKTGRADSSVVFRQDTVWIADPGDTVQYTIDVINAGEMICRDISVSDTLSKWLALVSVPEGARLEGNVIHWSIQSLTSRGGAASFTYTCAVDTFLPPWDEMILNDAEAVSPEDVNPGNNQVTDTLWVVGLHPPGPQIEVSPLQVQPGDSVRISVMTPIIIESWDLVVFYEDGSTLYQFGDDFIASHHLLPSQWLTVDPEFEDTYMRTDQKREQIGFVIETTDVWGSVRKDTAFVTIRSSDEFALDQNVFRPHVNAYLTLKFKLSSNRHATISVFDLSGHHVTELASEPFPAGWNDLQWDGHDDYGRVVGSGIYLAVLDAGDFKQAHKFILVR